MLHRIHCTLPLTTPHSLNVSSLIQIYFLFLPQFVWDEPFPGLMVFEVVKKVVDGDERPEIKKAMPKFWVEVMEKCKSLAIFSFDKLASIWLVLFINIFLYFLQAGFATTRIDQIWQTLQTSLRSGTSEP